ncbi:hypothetical protein OK142_15680 [Agrobacterium sp. BT-220-3]|nr:hypothetical protein [Agrobacterium sp. BT-220-3]
MQIVKIVSLTPGCYSINLTTDKSVKAIEIADTEGRVRCCRLDTQIDEIQYYLKINTPLTKITINIVGETQNNSLVDIEFSPLSALNFYCRMLLAGFNRHRIQSFGPGEKLLCYGGLSSYIASLAFSNVEYRYLYLYGLDDASIAKNGWDWADKGWVNNGISNASGDNSVTRTCIYVHMHYLETWPEIKTVLSMNAQDMDIIVTVTSSDNEFPKEVQRSFPHAKVIRTENRGRDVGPFLELLRQDFFAPYDAVCKIHGKLSRKEGKETISGHRIRRYALASLLADGAAREIAKMFRETPDIGLAGPLNLRLPPAEESVNRYIKSELVQMRRVFDLAKIKFESHEVIFFAGTMFWFRPAALKLLQDINLGITDFEIENGAKRDTLQHGLERIFCTFVQKSGYRVAGLQAQSRPNSEATSVEGV